MKLTPTQRASCVLRAQHGQGLVEYALILFLIAIVAVFSLLFIGGGISTILNSIGTSI